MAISFLCFHWNLKLSVQGHLGTVGKIIGYYSHSLSLSCFLALRATIGAWKLYDFWKV
ncbi:rCG28480 [Rattus norvegicus]|uniref:RCG28480 n=1 Tax=Rattus norvegicus TaxID=10116 RepID=A6HWS7_RAT|nr:rCG28480 [Rattus norvegicus]